MSMAEQTEKREDQNTTEEPDGGDGGGHRGAVRAAAIAAATGATALAARKALSGRDQPGEGGQKSGRRASGGGQGDSMFGEMLTSGWSAAKDSLLPFTEEAAGAAGEWVGRNSPELVRDSLVPRFIRGFERARKSSSGAGE
jgi:hypothetical protein